jgi:uncharacterized membrane protein
MGDKKPWLFIPKTTLEKVLDLLGNVLLLMGIINLIIEWAYIPDTVPTHFNAGGEADGWGSKRNLWILLVVGFLIWFFLSILEKFPHLYNYLMLTEENRERQYKNARLMMNIFKNETLVFFVYLSVKMTDAAKEGAGKIGFWDVPLFLAVVLGTMIFFLVRSIKLK